MGGRGDSPAVSIRGGPKQGQRETEGLPPYPRGTSLDPLRPAAHVLAAADVERAPRTPIPIDSGVHHADAPSGSLDVLSAGVVVEGLRGGGAGTRQQVKEEPPGLLVSVRRDVRAVRGAIVHSRTESR